MGYEA